MENPYASLPPDVRADFDNLIEVELTAASRFLDSSPRSRDASFLPYGAFVNPQGKTILAGSYSGAPQDLLRQLLEGLRDELGRGNLRSCCHCLDVRIPASSGIGKIDAVMLSLEHQSGASITLYVPYQLNPRGPVAFGTPTLAPGKPVVFLTSTPDAA